MIYSILFQMYLYQDISFSIKDTCILYFVLDILFNFVHKVSYLAHILFDIQGIFIVI